MKVLIISNNPFSKTRNNGKTLESMFSWISKDNIAQLYFHNAEEPDFEYCSNYFCISDINICKNFFFNNDIGIQVLKTENKNIEYNHKKKFVSKYNLNSLQLFRDLLWEYGYRDKTRLIHWARKFNPNIIFFVGGNFGYAHKLAIFLSKKCNAKLYTYFTDDYVLYPKYYNIIQIIQKYRLRKIYRKTISLSDNCFAIGQIMSKEYNTVYNREFFPIVNVVDVKDLILPKQNNKNIVISYLGNLGLNRWKILTKLGGLIKEINSKSNYNVSIFVYTQSVITKQMEKAFSLFPIEYKGSVSKDDINEVFINSDILLHVESDDIYNRSLTKLSISTKIPEYLASNRPILAYGPTDVASLKFLQENNIGFVLDIDKPTLENVKILGEFLNNYNKRITLAEKGFIFAKQHLSKEVLQKEFKKYFKNV